MYIFTIHYTILVSLYLQLTVFIELTQKCMINAVDGYHHICYVTHIYIYMYIHRLWICVSSNGKVDFGLIFVGYSTFQFYVVFR